MPVPTSREQSPTSWIRTTPVTDPTRVIMVERDLIIDDETAKLIGTLAPPQQLRKYFVFSFPRTHLDFDPATGNFTVTLPVFPLPNQVVGIAFDFYDAAEAVYEARAIADTTVTSVARGFRGLQHIGTEDA